MQKLYTLKEAQAILKVSRMTLYRLRDAGKLKFYEDGKNKKISESQINAYLAQTEIDNGKHKPKPKTKAQPFLKLSSKDILILTPSVCFDNLPRITLK